MSRFYKISLLGLFLVNSVVYVGTSTGNVTKIYIHDNEVAIGLTDFHINNPTYSIMKGSPD